ncbi:uncharacterized protein LOC34617639 [Cyclospora cayetanensis]|uniref:Uncharacterized protein LOC34617639 n=1 Tax=Cyclospora cayetanensis TaxID=88456 RepID=A0A6P6RWF9_9EIME|nr:uncharacterized protein LOC34617639 [Cyclospora cayetanensis]
MGRDGPGGREVPRRGEGVTGGRAGTQGYGAPGTLFGHSFRTAFSSFKSKQRNQHKPHQTTELDPAGAVEADGADPTHNRPASALNIRYIGGPQRRSVQDADDFFEIPVCEGRRTSETQAQRAPAPDSLTTSPLSVRAFYAGASLIALHPSPRHKDEGAFSRLLPAASSPQAASPGGCAAGDCSDGEESPPGGLASAADLLQRAAAEALLLQQLLLLLLRVVRGLTVALGRQAAAAGYHALALKAEQLQLRQRWIAGISDDSILTSKSKSTTNPTGATERAAGIAVVGCVLRALATRLDESWPLRDLLRPPLKDVASPRGPPFAESPKAFADALKGYLGKAALGSHKGAHGESRIKDFLTMEARGGMCDQRLAEGDFAHSERLPFPYRLRLWTLDLVYAVRHLCTHFSRDHSPTRSCDSSGGPGGPPSTKQGGPRERAGPPPGDRLRGTAAWLLSSEAMEALGGAPLWLFGLPATSESALFKEEAASRRSDGWVTVAEALQAAAVRAFAAGGGPFPPPMEDPLLTRASAESDGSALYWALYPFYTPLQNCIRLLWHCTDSAGAHAPSESPLRGVYGLLPPADCISNGGGDALWRGGPEALSASFSEDEESQLAFECHRELLQQGVEPPFSRLLGASLSTLRSIYGSEEDGEAPRPLDPQRKAQSSARQGPSGPQPLVAQHLKQQQQRRLLQHHIAEDCLDILSRGWAPSDSLSGRASLRSREDSGGPLAVGYPPLTASSLGPTMPLLVCSLEQMLASWGRNSGEDASQGVPLPPELCISALFAEGKLRAAAERGR